MPQSELDKYPYPDILTDLDAVELGSPGWDYWGLRAQPEQWLADLVTAKRIKARVIAAEEERLRKKGL